MSTYLRKKRIQSHKRTVPTWLIALMTVAVLLALGATAVGGFFLAQAFRSAPSLADVSDRRVHENSIVYAADGTRLGFIQADELRTPVPLQDMPLHVQQATIAIEDARFYRHQGIDYIGVARAAVRDIQAGAAVEGASTITQQLVRNVYITRERTWKRKLLEAKLSQELEKKRSKQWILQEYLNNIPYGTVGGQTALGVAAASRIFFDKSVKQLSISEAALLAGLPQAPSEYNPFSNRKVARYRRNTVLEKMYEQRYITARQYRRAKRSSLGVQFGSYYRKRREQYFFDYVKSELIQKYGIEKVRSGGLEVHTTIDLRLQQAARSAIRGQLTEPSDPAAAVVTLDHRTGYIKAMASSSRYQDTTFNYAAQGHRQPGSTFKIFTLLAAIDQGINPTTTNYASRPLSFTDERYGPIKVANYSESYLGSMNLVEATLKSDNTIFMQLALDVGPRQVRETARKLGIKSRLEALPSETLGGLKQGVTPLEMANAYATIAAGGIRSKPLAIRRVVFPDGTEDVLGTPRRKRVFDAVETYEVTKILQQNITRGTGGRARLACPAAGKTGTTDNFRDAWFVGYTPRLASSVWIGYPNSQKEMRSVHGISVAGGTFPAAIWGTYMDTARGKYCKDFKRPKGAKKWKPFSSRYARRGVVPTPYNRPPGAYNPPVGQTPPPTTVAPEPSDPAPAPVDPAPVDPAPVDPAPVDPAPVDPAPAPVDPAPEVGTETE